MKKRTHHGFHIPRFYVIYLAVTVAVILIIIASLGIVSNRLAEYEAAQPKYVAAQVFAQYFDPEIKYTELIENARYNAGLATPAEILEYLTNETLGSELSYAPGSSNSENELKYIVRAGSKQLASINLTVSEKTTEHGYKMYEFSYIELYLNVENPPPPETGSDNPSGLTITIDVPSSYSVTIDGELLATENITSSHLRTDLFRRYPANISGIEYTVYTVTSLEALPAEVIVTDIDGARADVTFDAATNTYTSGIAYSEALASEYSDFVTDAIESYAAFMQHAPGTSLNKIANSGYFDLESTVYAGIEAASKDLWMVTRPAGNDFENVKIGEFYAFSSDVFSCHISFTQILHRDGSEDYPDHINMYVFLHMTDDGYKIFEWYNA